MAERKRVLIVGGVAGGATCAARLRRVDESAEIVVFERGPHVSFANCGLPYFVGDVIKEESKLLLASPALFRDRFNIDVRVGHEVLAIGRGKKEIEVRTPSGEIVHERYDALVLSPGALPIKPPLAGIDRPGIFTLRNVPDSVAIREWIEKRDAKSAIVVGGGFIGLEMAENLRHRGLAVTLLELADQLMPPLDPEMATPVKKRVIDAGVEIRLGDAAASFDDEGGRVSVLTKSGARIAADLVILSIGVRPDSDLARRAGLDVNERGGIRVDAQMKTSDPAIWAVGDAVEVRDFITGDASMIPLAGPANRQGRIAADSIADRYVSFRGVQGTAVCGVFGLTVAMTGVSEKGLRRAKRADYGVAYSHPVHHVGYYPGAKQMHLKVIFEQGRGRILGAQAIGEEGVERRIDVIATAIQHGGTVHDLEEAELCYAPQYGAAKDPVNMAGMIGANALRGDSPLVRWVELEKLVAMGATILDVREESERQAGSIPGSIHIPLGNLRSRLDELSREQMLLVHCQVGQRAHTAVRLLRQNGFDARNLSGGYLTWSMLPRR